MLDVVQWVRDRVNEPDEKYVERVRKAMAHYDRLRWFYVGMFGFLFIAWLGLVIAWTILIPRLLDLLPTGNPWIGRAFLFGTTMGLVAGCMVFYPFYGLKFVLVCIRDRRLLIRYHDAAEQARQMGQKAGEHQ
jgi:prepilin signal peptidase PulO-like enzyme (type II secretory pathway)